MDSSSSKKDPKLKITTIYTAVYFEMTIIQIEKNSRTS